MFYVAAIGLIGLGNFLWRVADLANDAGHLARSAGRAIIMSDIQSRRDTFEKQKLEWIRSGHAREVLKIEETLEKIDQGGA